MCDRGMKGEYMRDITRLHPELQMKIRELMSLCEENNLKIGISECLRTAEEQNELYAKGRTKPGRIVTNANGSEYLSMLEKRRTTCYTHALGSPTV